MRCHKCGASSRVVETREEDAKTILRRRRLCDNGHRFNTYEVGERLFKTVSPRRKAQALETTLKAVAMYARDLRIWEARMVQGIKIAAIALGEGIYESSVRQISLKFPRLNPEHAKRVEAEHGREAARGDASSEG